MNAQNIVIHERAGERLAPSSWALLRPRVDDANSDIVVATCTVASQIGSIDARRAALSRLVTVLSSASWFAQGKIEDCLAALYTGGRDIVDEEIALCNVLPTEQRNAEGVLRALLRVKQRTNAAATERKG